MQRLHAQSIPPSEPLDDQFDARLLRRRALQVVALLAVVGLIAWLAPGLDEVRTRLRGADAGWLALAVGLEALSCLSYVVMFGPVFCTRMTWRSSYELGMSELAVGSLVPASGAGGLALGAWALRKDGMAAQDIAERTVAFYALKGAANFAAVAVVGIVMFAGLGPSFSPLLTILPAGMAIATIAGVMAVPLLLRRAPGIAQRGGRWTTIAKGLDALAAGLGEAGRIVRRRDWQVIAGSLGYWAFDNAVLWACFRAFGEAPALTVVLMAYLLGQLGGLLPIPGGIGGIDGGLIGALIVFGVGAAAATVAVLAYRLILFWLPLLVGGVAFAGLRRGVGNPERPDLCQPLTPSPSSDKERPMAACTHLDQIEYVDVPAAVPGCEDCLKTGDTWMHLRMCQICGHIACCDDSPNRHATAHHHATSHPIIRSAEPGEDWSFCYADEAVFRVSA